MGSSQWLVVSGQWAVGSPKGKSPEVNSVAKRVVHKIIVSVYL